MRNFKLLFVFAALGSGMMLSGCHKDCGKKNDVVSKKGLVLTGAQEVPVKTTEASGTMDISYKKSTHVLTFTINWSHLTGIPTGSHIHGTAPRGVNAAIKYDFFGLIPKATAGTFTNSVMVDGVAIKEDSLLMGFYYLNIHTALNPGAEIRGQIEF